MRFSKPLAGLLVLAVVLALGTGLALAKDPVKVRPKPQILTIKLIDINSATVDELQEIKGIGPVLADRIVKYRKKHGPFKSKADIQKIEGVGPKTYEDIKPYIIARQPKKKK